MFVAGGTAAYMLLALAVSRRRVVRASRPPAALWENAFVVPTLAATYGIDALIDNALVNFFVSPFAATLIYLLGLTVLVTWITVREEMHRGGAEPWHPRTSMQSPTNTEEVTT